MFNLTALKKIFKLIQNYNFKLNLITKSIMNKLNFIIIYIN